MSPFVKDERALCKPKQTKATAARKAEAGQSMYFRSNQKKKEEVNE